MGTPTDPTPERRDIAPEADQYEISPRLITAARLALLVLLRILTLELAIGRGRRSDAVLTHISGDPCRR